MALGYAWQRGLLPVGADPHSFQPAPRDLARLLSGVGDAAGAARALEQPLAYGGATDALRASLRAHDVVLEPLPARRDLLTEQDRTPVAELGREATELVAGISLSNGVGAFPNQAFVQHVNHFQERHFRRNIAHCKCFKLPFGVLIFLSPHF